LKVLFILFAINSKWWPIHAFGNSYLTFNSSVVYDDNIFRYSRRDLSDFENGKNPERFPFSTVDDLILRLTTTFLHPGKVRYSIRVGQNNFLRNPDKDYLRLVFSAKFHTFVLRLSYIPRYLLRYYPDIDTPSGDYKACRYSYNSLRLGFERSLTRSVSLKITGSLFGYHYSPSFTEYSNRGYSGEVSLNLKRRTFFFSLGGFYERSLAKATDQPGETPETSEDPDISYWRWGTKLSLTKKLGSFRITLSYRYRYKDFIERKKLQWIVDPFHRDRIDRDHRIYLRVSYPINRRISLYLRGLYELRNVESPYWEQIYEIKDYKRKVFYFGLNSLL